MSPLPILSDITNEGGSDGFITPRKADRDTAKPPPVPIPTPTSCSSCSNSVITTPPPQNLKGDPHRQAKVKTELCLYYLKDLPCPFGERCNYAHGWDELRFKKLKELERNGLIPNASQYRTHPCLNWITTGSCPFGQRCSSIHDPRAAGPTSSWMPFADAPVANLETTVNVDKFYHRHNASLHASNPLIGQMFWEKCRPSTLANGGSSKKGCLGAIGKPLPLSDPHANDPWGVREWKDTYDLVCNLDASCYRPAKVSPLSSYTLMSKSSFATAMAAASAGDISGGSSKTIYAKSSNGAGKKNMTEEQRLSIALLMSSGDEGLRQEDYIYSHSHLIFGELCMILETRYFRLLSADNASMAEANASNNILVGTGGFNSICEISNDEYNASRTPWDTRYPYRPESIVIARKIAFGPVGEVNANVSVWFDIPSSQIAPYTPQMVKRLKRFRNKAQLLDGNKRKVSSLPPFPPLPFHIAVVEPSAPNVPESFHSVTHQPFFFTTVANDDSTAWDLVRDILLHRIRTLRGEEPALALSNEEHILQDRYFALKSSMEMWRWPVASGRAAVDEHTKVPECIAKYNPAGHDHYVAQVWSSFMNATQEVFLETEADGSFDMSFGGDKTKFDRPRLATFRQLSQGISAPKSEWNKPLVGGDLDLLKNDGKGGPWDLVKDHYLGEVNPSSPAPDTPSPPKRPNALPLGSKGEKRHSIFVKLQNNSQ